MRRRRNFEVDHTKQEKGIYVSRVDKVGSETVTTFDLCMKKPYADAPLKPETAHTLEHCLATYRRNMSDDVCMSGRWVA